MSMYGTRCFGGDAVYATSDTTTPPQRGNRPPLRGPPQWRKGHSPRRCVPLRSRRLDPHWALGAARPVPGQRPFISRSSTAPRPLLFHPLATGRRPFSTSSRPSWSPTDEVGRSDCLAWLIAMEIHPYTARKHCRLHMCITSVAL